jgi:hypothetical protein
MDPDPLVRGMDPDPDPVPDPDPDPSITSKTSKKNLDSYCFVTSFDFLSLKMMKMYLQKVISKITFFEKNVFFVGILKVNDVYSMIRIRIRIH